MPFMKPHYVKGDWAVIERRGETISIIPAEYFSRSDLSKDEEVTIRKNMWGGQLSASGYMDQTDWILGKSLKEVKAYIEQMYDVDPDTGEDLE